MAAASSNTLRLSVTWLVLTWLVYPLQGPLFAQEGDVLDLARQGLSDSAAEVRLAALELLQYQWRMVRAELQAEMRTPRKEQIEQLLQLQRSLTQQAGRLAELVQTDPSFQVRQKAIFTLAMLEPDLRDPKVVSAWKQLLQSTDERLTLAAAQAWRTLFEGRLAELTNPRLETEQSLQIGRQLAGDLAVLAPMLSLGLTHTQVSVRAATLAVLEEVCTGLTQRLSGLHNQLGTPEYRRLALAIAQDLLVLTELLQRDLQDCLAWPHAQIRRPACHLLETLGEFRQLLDHEPLFPETGQVAEQLRRRLALSVPELLRVVHTDHDGQIRLDALLALEMIEPLSSRTWPVLLEALQDEYVPVRWTAARCLEAGKSTNLSETERRAIVRQLAVCLAEEDEVSMKLRLVRSLQTWRVDLGAARRELARALNQAASTWPGVNTFPFGTAHRQAKPQVRDQEVLLALLHVIREYAEHHRRVSQEPLPSEWLPGLTAALAGEKADVRIEACRILALYGQQAYPVRSDLVRLLRDADPQVRGAAASTLLRITPPTR